MKNADIATLDLAKLFNSLSSLAENNRKSAAGRARTAPKKKAPPPDKRPLVFRTPWKDEAIILIISEITCQDCGSVHRTPSSGLLLRRSHPVVGTHLRQLAPEEPLPDLPHHTEIHYTTVPACHLCFPLTEAIQAMRPKQPQLTLVTPLPENQYLNPPPPPEGRPQFSNPRAIPFTPIQSREEPPHRPTQGAITSSRAPKPGGTWEQMLRRMHSNNDREIYHYTTFPHIFPKELLS